MACWNQRQLYTHHVKHGGTWRKPRVALHAGNGWGLFEIRAKGQEGIGRAFFCTLVGRRIIILHCFIKKTEKTPKHELDIALQRMKEIKHGQAT